jgi:branched-chain amino acid transport system substrate-binding protein
MDFKKRAVSVLAFLPVLTVLLAAGASGQSTPGVTGQEIVIGSCAALEGPSEFLGRETISGARAYFQFINEQGGVNGRKLKLVSFNDDYDPEKAPACWDRLMEAKPFALGFFVGTPTAIKYVPLAEKNQIPIVGLFTGAQTLYVPLRHWVVNVRASYFDETRAQVDGLWKHLNYRKIAVIYPDDSFGAAVLAGVQAALSANGGSPVATAAYVRQTDQADAAIEQTRAAGPDAVILVGPSNTVAPILKQAHQKDWHPLFVTVSFVGTDDLIQQAGADADGMVITQVVPPYYLTELKTIALYRRSLTKYAPGSKPNFVSLEGFVDAMVMVEGLKKAGPNLTREGLIRGIESIHEWDAGLGPDLKVNYSARGHQGFNHVIPSVVRSERIVPFTDWSIVPAK